MSSYYDKYPVERRTSSHDGAARATVILGLIACTIAGIVAAGWLLWSSSSVPTGRGDYEVRCAAVMTDPVRTADLEDGGDYTAAVCGQQRTRRLALAGFAVLVTVGAGLASRSVFRRSEFGAG
ncbi:hypothetical protein [Gordonia neofelifaecis]|uniref:Transmembrane protein n=1 Tax=Gordonia neofelifaecis NRRL B-59395 TaxID=644548 RepID=F1YHR6_9ACTN|nr:hypothetical protein [Gordonia neofelifaecis]EGD55904.1 hypothetical protein SCNU_06670 [Gordonia neofelifaecis NRRL B-59395]